MEKLLHSLLFSIAFVAVSSGCYAQNISGIINIYTPVTNITGNVNIVVNSTSVFCAGDKVLIMQMKGASIIQTNTVNYYINREYFVDKIKNSHEKLHLGNFNIIFI